MFIKMKRLINRVVKTKLKYMILILIAILYMFGVHTHLFEKDYYSEFSYPFDGDVDRYVNQLKNHQKPDYEPINIYNYKFLFDAKSKCASFNSGSKLRLVYIVKSALPNFNRRIAIRESWGYESRFSDVPIRTVFVLGVGTDKTLEEKVAEESKKFGDIVQSDFIDAYFNNTIKTMMGFKWAMEFCPNSKFYFFSDDDMYVSTKNVLRFIRNPVNYPAYLQLPIASVDESVTNLNNEHLNPGLKSLLSKSKSRSLSQVLDFELPENVILYSGYVFVSSPHRHYTSKWYITLHEYPYHMWPPYVSAGAYILSQQALVNLYYGSMYTKHFRFDDIYVGIIAKKVNIEPFHCDEFYFYKKDYNIYNYKYTIASHGYDDPVELLRVWNEQRSSNNA